MTIETVFNLVVVVFTVANLAAMGLETDVQAEVKKDNINVEGTGAHGDSHLKKVKFKKLEKVANDIAKGELHRKQQYHEPEMGTWRT